MSPESSAAPFPTAWRTVSFGAFCLSAGAIVFLLGILAFSAAIAFNAQLASAPTLEGMASRDRHLPPLSIIGCLLILFTGAMFWLAGLCMFCIIPPETGARPFAWGAMICWLLSLVMLLQVPLVSLGIRVPGPRLGREHRDDRDPHRMVYGSDAGFGLAAGMFAVAGGGLTMGVVCSAAHRFKNERLAARARWLLLYQIVALPVLIFVLVLHSSLTESLRHLDWYYNLLPFALPLVGIPTVGCVWQLRVLAEMRRMLRTAEEIAMEQPLPV